MTTIASMTPLPWSPAGYDSLFPTSSSASDPATDALEALGQSYADEVSLLISQSSTSSPGGSDPLASLGTSGTTGSDATSFDEQALLSAMTPASGQVQLLLQQAGLGTASGGGLGYSSGGLQLGGAASQLDLYA